QYQLQRDQVIRSLVNSPEFRARITERYYRTFIGPNRVAPGVAVRPAELTAAEALYASTNVLGQTGRLETILASILSSAEFRPLTGPGSLNSVWLTDVYDALLGPGSLRPSYDTQLAFLDSQTGSPAALQAARNRTALEILLNTDLYRREIVAE